MNRFSIALFLLFPATGFAQQYINKNKSEVKKELDKNSSAIDGISTTITETDSSITTQVKGPGGISTLEVYTFDKSGKCSSEKTISNCDSCYKLLLKAVINNKKYRWKKINGTQYVSGFSAGIFIETQTVSNIYSFIILNTNLDRKMYKFLLRNKLP